MNPAVERLLSEVENPVVECAFVCAVGSGQPILIKAIPDSLVVPALLLASVAKEWGERPVLDNMLAAAKRVRNWLDQQNPVFESHLLLNTIFNGLPLASNSQAVYIVQAYKELTGTFNVSPGRDNERRKAKRNTRKSSQHLLTQSA